LILEATRRQLADRGYARMSVESIATATGVSKPTIYRRWPTKEALALAACEDLRVPAQPAATGDLARDLVAQLGHLRDALGQSDGMSLVDALLVEERHTPALLEMFRARVVTPCREAMRDVLADARERGEVRADVDLDAAVHMLLGAYYARYVAGERFHGDWARTAVSTLLAGIRT
jgi:AcrR family transcriptional regulator